MSYEQISTTLNDNILTLTLNRPEKLNAFTRIMLNEMIDVFEHDGRSPLDARFGGHDMFGWMWANHAPGWAFACLLAFL